MSNLSSFVFSIISGSLPFCLTVLVGGYFTFKTRFFQLRYFGRSLSVLKGEKGGGINGFSAMCNSLSAALGTGNIVGVAAALSMGGAGAVFWMWVSAFLGMVIKSCEIALGVFYRSKSNGNFTGGPHIYIKNALPKQARFLGVIFALIGIFATFFCGNMTQINSAVSGCSQSLNFRFVMGALSSVIVFFIICGGVSKIADFLSRLLPFMAVLYILLCLGVILKNFDAVPQTFKSIFVGAFSPKAVTGGAIGSVLRVISVGASKGIFSNEAGVGTAAIAHASVSDAKPFSQSLYGIFEVFVDTILLCTLTALTILTSGVIIDYNKAPVASLTISALSTLYGNASGYILSVLLLLFGISSVIGWATYGISFSEFLFGTNGKRAFIIIYPFFCVVGAVLSASFVWQTAELLNGVLVIINLLVLIFLSKRVIGLLKEKENGKKNRKSSKKLKKRRSVHNLLRS